MRQIAIVGEDGETSVYDLDLERQIAISGAAEADAHTGDRLTNWPMWSPSGDRLAYFRYEINNGELSASGVTVVEADGSRAFSAYHAPNEAPIYMSWSPNGERIAVLVQAQEQLFLRVVDARENRPALTVAQGAPLYFVWQPDSRGMVIHVGLGRRSMPQTRVAWVRFEGGQVSQAPVVRAPASSFRAPCWSAALQSATIALESAQGSEIALLASADADPEVLFASGTSPAFMWNPTGDLLACASRSAESGSQSPSLYTGISLYSRDARQPRPLVETPVLAYFWTPDGRRLVYAAGGDVADRAVSIHAIDVATQEPVDIGWVRPSRDLFMLLSHFDQYAQSMSLLSPDSSELTMAASRAKERENGSVPTARQILVRPLTSDGDERVIARGRLACWRPG